MMADSSSGDFEGLSIDTGVNRRDFFGVSRFFKIAPLNFGVRDRSPTCWFGDRDPIPSPKCPTPWQIFHRTRLPSSR